MFSLQALSFRRWTLPLLATGLLLALLLFAFPYNSGDTSLRSPLGFALWNTWTVTEENAQDHTYCLLVPLMVGYLIYEKRHQLARTEIKGTWWGLIGLALGLALFWIGSRAGKQYLGCMGIQVLLAGAIYWFWGTAFFRKLLFAWVIIIFAWPLPFLDTAVAFPMRMMVSHTAFHAVNLIGLPCLQSGTALISAATATAPIGSRFQIDVADPCSGLHSLLPLLMFSSLYCYLFLPKRWQQWTVFFSAFFFAITGNVVRIVLLVIGSTLWGPAFAIGTNEQPSTYHEACGFAVFVVALGLECLFGSLLIALDRRWFKPSSLAPTRETTPDTLSQPVQVVPAWRSGAVLGLTAAMLLVLLVTPPIYLPPEAGVVMDLPTSLKVDGIDGGHFYGSEAAVSDVELHNLPHDTVFARKQYNDYHHHEIFFSIVLSGVQQYTIHPPEVCLVAQGWTIKDYVDESIKLESGHDLVVRNLHIERDALDPSSVHHLVKADYIYWYVADNMTTPSHLVRNLRSSWDRIAHNRDHRWAYVIAMTPVTETLYSGGMDEPKTNDLLKSFIREIVPTFQKNEIPGYTANNS